MEERVHINKLKVEHREVDLDPTWGTSADYILHEVDICLVSGSPATYLLHMLSHHSWKWEICLVPLGSTHHEKESPFSQQGNGQIQKLQWPNICDEIYMIQKSSWEFTWYNTPLGSHGLHKHGEIICQIRKLSLHYIIRFFTINVSSIHGIVHKFFSLFKRRKKWLKWLLNRVLWLPQLHIALAF